MSGRRSCEDEDVCGPGCKELGSRGEPRNVRRNSTAPLSDRVGDGGKAKALYAKGCRHVAAFREPPAADQSESKLAGHRGASSQHPRRVRHAAEGRAIVAAMAGTVPAPGKPLLRGVLHQVAFFGSLAVAPLLIVGAHPGRPRAAAAVFAGSVIACFGASALYRRVTWTPRVRLWMRRIDHAGVYLLIAGTYTPVSLLALTGTLRPVLLTIVWVGAAAAIVLKFVWVAAPKWLAAAIGIALGWVAVVALPQLIDRLEPAAVILLAVGGLAYTAGAVVYARRRPDPAPSVFGYHELFHALTIVAVVCQYIAIAFFVVRVG